MEQNKGKETVRKLWGKYQFVLLVALVGVVLLLWPAGKPSGGESKTPPETRTAVSEDDALQAQEERMRAILSKIAGVGELELMLTVESTQEREFAVDTELSYSGQTAAPDDYTRRSETVLVSGNEGDAPVVARYVSPTYRGAVVVCQGGGNAEVKLAVTQAVAALTGLSSDRITVVKCQS